MKRFDVVVIGSGPAGEGAAMQAAKAGRSVALVERFREVGGGCTHWSTIPSKTLRQGVQQLLEFKRNPLFEKAAAGLEPTYPDMLRRAEAVIAAQVRMRRGFYERNGVRLFEGHAAFAGPHELRVGEPRSAGIVLEAESFVIATGTRPYRPPDLDFSHPRVLDSDKVLALSHTPRSIAIYGAGTVGCEYASIFRGLEVKVELINTWEKLLGFLDDEIIDALSYHLRDQGVIIRHNEECEKVEPREGEVVLHLKSGKQVRTDYLLWANGRTGNSEGMGLDEIGIKRDDRGYVLVNENFQTALPHVYAAGDVVGPPALASAAYDQGRFAATHLTEGRCEYQLVRQIPTSIYTSPEISAIGRTERELTAEKIPFEVGHTFFRSLARAQITGHTVGMLKILFHRETLQILGVHCFGAQASEIIHIGQAVMSQEGPGNSLRYFINTTFNYPTMAEAYRTAALNGFNRLEGIAPAHPG